MRYVPSYVNNKHFAKLVNRLTVYSIFCQYFFSFFPAKCLYTNMCIFICNLWTKTNDNTVILPNNLIRSLCICSEFSCVCICRHTSRFTCILFYSVLEMNKIWETYHFLISLLFIDFIILQSSRSGFIYIIFRFITENLRYKFINHLLSSCISGFYYSTMASTTSRKLCLDKSTNNFGRSIVTDCIC